MKRNVLPLLATFRLLSLALVLLALCALRSHALGVPHGYRQQTAHHLLVGYFPQWGIYNPQPYYVKTMVTSGSVDRLNQINFANASVEGGHCSLGDVNADLNTTYTAETSVTGKSDDQASQFRGYFHQLEELKRRYPKLKILISLEGKASDFAIDARPENRQEFVASCINLFLRGRFAAGIAKPGIFDGFDVDWESPQQEDAANFRALLEEFRRQMNALRPGFRLSVAVGQAPDMLPGTDWRTVAALVDQVGILNYDYAGPWNTHTGFVAPLFATSHGPYDASSIERSIASYKSLGIPQRKLLMGLPFYGYSWTGVEKTNNGLYQQGRGVHGDQPYRYIRALSAPFATYRDQRSQAPWLFDGQTFWTFEDPTSVRFKVSYASDQHLGGVMIWELSGDTEDAELLNTAYHSLRHPLKHAVFDEAAAL